MNLQNQHDTELEHREKVDLADAIGNHVIQSLGRPDQLFKVQVRRLWENRYRVNVLVGVDVTLTKVVNSYFLVTDINGDIVKSTPKIVRQY
jgi:hypothetical protein